MPVLPNLRLRLLFVLAVVIAPAVASARGVTVEKSPVVVVRRTFDRRNPPPDMPPLGRRADAVTHLKFGCSTNATYEVTSRRRDTSRRRGGTGGCTATARIKDLDVRIDLEITIWVPRGARRKLVEHEEGHRVIGERAYAVAERAAREEGAKWVGRSVTAKAADCAAAADEAVKDANHRFCQAYLERTSGWSSRVGDVYDDLTDHGRRDEPAVDEAIELAFRRDAESRQEADRGPVPPRPSSPSP
jgi:hypothetical protein